MASPWRSLALPLNSAALGAGSREVRKAHGGMGYPSTTRGPGLAARRLCLISELGVGEAAKREIGGLLEGGETALAVFANHNDPAGPVARPQTRQQPVKRRNFPLWNSPRLIRLAFAVARPSCRWRGRRRPWPARWRRRRGGPVRGPSRRGCQRRP